MCRVLLLLVLLLLLLLQAGHIIFHMATSRWWPRVVAARALGSTASLSPSTGGEQHQRGIEQQPEKGLLLMEMHARETSLKGPPISSPLHLQKKAV